MDTTQPQVQPPQLPQPQPAPQSQAPQEVGYVQSVRDYLVNLNGLPTIQINDLVENEEGVRGVVSALHSDVTEVLILDGATILPGDMFKRTTNRLGISVGNQLLGRAINPLGLPIDARGQIINGAVEHQEEIDKTALGIFSREFIKEQFISGLTLVDTMIPLGKGQRELVMGDAHSGKSTFLIDLILNSKNSQRICIYAMIGKPATNVRNLIEVLRQNDALSYSIIVAASSADPAPLIFMTPHTAMTIAEFFQKQGKDVLIILDDLGVHAKVYREISLLGNQSPGRESYPGDIFYQHAHLLERAGRYNMRHGGGSITAIPVIEINSNNYSSYIATNLMSMTDGHLLFNSALHNQGMRPAIDIALSVSRVGRQTQNRVHNALAQKIREVIAQALQFETLSRFSSELPPETQLILNQKQQIDILLRQDNFAYLSPQMQSALLSLVFTSYMHGMNHEATLANKNKITNTFISHPTFKAFIDQFNSYKSIEDLISALEAQSKQLDEAVRSAK